MKRLVSASLAVMLLTLSSLWAVDLVVAEGVDVPSGLVGRLEDAIDEYGADVIPPSVTTLVVEGCVDEGSSLLVTVSGFTLAFDGDDIAASVDDEVEAFFTYPSWIDEGSGSRLDYVYGSSYSTYHLPDASRGRVYDLIAPYSDRPLARFIVSDVEDDGLVELHPQHIGSVHAGLELRRGGSWAVTSTLSQVFVPDYQVFMSLRLKNTALLYPFNPSLGFEYGIGDDGTQYFTGLAGVEYVLYMGGLFDSRFTLIQDGRLYAGLDVMLGWGDGFCWGAAWRVGYQHAPLRHLFWSVGFESAILRNEDLDREVLKQYRLSLGVGVSF